MNVAYVDSSALVAVAFSEAEAAAIADRLRSYERLYSSNLLEAEVRSACSREKIVWNPILLDRIEWVFPDRPLAAEMEVVLATGYLRGADLWHVATALYTVPQPGEMAFVTLDEGQRTVAADLGFRV